MSAPDPMDLSALVLTSRQWEYGRVDEATYALRMILGEDGRIAGYRYPNEHRWEFRGPRLAILDRSGCATSIFDRYEQRDGRLYLEGVFLPDNARHFLREVAKLDTLAVAGDTPTPREHLAPRRNLVVLRAGRSSVHRDWARDLDPADRSWDLCISWYGSFADFDEDPDADYHILQPGLQKWQAVHRLFWAHSPLWRYDFVAFPDDDLAWSWRGINTAFERMRDFDLLLGQPSLDPSGHVIHAITRRHEGTALRFTNFVEVMTPIFARAALRTCAETFALSRSGFGLDHIWPKLLGEPEHRIAIIDETSVVHTRPQAVNYDMGEAITEGQRLTTLFRAAERYDVMGSIKTLA